MSFIYNQTKLFFTKLRQKSASIQNDTWMHLSPFASSLMDANFYTKHIYDYAILLQTNGHLIDGFHSSHYFSLSSERKECVEYSTK